MGLPAARVYLALRERGVVRTRSEARIAACARLRAANGGDGARIEPPANWEAAAVERYLAGESGPAVAKALGLPVGRVYGVLRERGVLRPASEARRLEEARRRAVKAERVEAAPARVDGRVRVIPAELAAAVVERYAAGESGEAIAKDLGLGQGRVYRLLRERGVLRTLKEASALREARRRKGERRKESRAAQLQTHRCSIKERGHT